MPIVCRVGQLTGEKLRKREIEEKKKTFSKLNYCKNLDTASQANHVRIIIQYSCVSPNEYAPSSCAAFLSFVLVLEFNAQRHWAFSFTLALSFFYAHWTSDAQKSHACTLLDNNQ